MVYFEFICLVSFCTLGICELVIEISWYALFDMLYFSLIYNFFFTKESFPPFGAGLKSSTGLGPVLSIDTVSLLHNSI